MQPEANQTADQALGQLLLNYLDRALAEGNDELAESTAKGLRALVERILSKQAATPAPASDEVLAELEELEKQATPAPWTVWLGHGTIFYGEADINEAYQYSPANLRLFEGEDHDRQEALEDGELNIQPGGAEDDARLVAALRNAAPALLARVRLAEARLAALDKAYEVANSYADNVYGYPHSWAAIKYGFDNAPTVKGGQQDA